VGVVGPGTSEGVSRLDVLNIDGVKETLSSLFEHDVHIYRTRKNVYNEEKAALKM
jgi:hypothetical protein